MMSFEEFKSKALNEFKDFLPEPYCNYEIEVHPVNKLNRTLTGICVISESAKGGPCVYLETMFEVYQYNGSFDETMRHFVDCIEEGFQQIPTVPKFDLASVEDKVVFNVINANYNGELLAKAPHRLFGDLAVIYRVAVEVTDSKFASFVIDNSLAKHLGVDENALYELSQKNTPGLFPAKIMRFEDHFAEVMRKQGVPENVVKAQTKEMKAHSERKMFTVSVRAQLGGNALLYADVLGKVAKKLGSDCYIIPSSVEEIIVLPAELPVKHLASMLADVNDHELRPSDILSYSIYKYSLADGSVKIAESDVA